MRLAFLKQYYEELASFGILADFPCRDFFLEKVAKDIILFSPTLHYTNGWPWIILCIQNFFHDWYHHIFHIYIRRRVGDGEDQAGHKQFLALIVYILPQTDIAADRVSQLHFLSFDANFHHWIIILITAFFCESQNSFHIFFRGVIRSLVALAIEFPDTGNSFRTHVYRNIHAGLIAALIINFMTFDLSRVYH